ncbi:MAG: hypothetical protein ACRDRT_16415 [Pseudonocardiaceae bacterium]
MSTLWTPSGERPIRRDPEPVSSPLPTVAPGGAGPADYPEGITPEMAAEISAMQEQMVRTPAAVIIVNQCLSFYELAALHLDQETPILAEAQVAIDAFAAVIDALGPRLGPNEAPLREALAQIRLAFVEVKNSI